MQHYLEDIRVSDENTYITDGDKDLTTAEIGSGFWSCAFDRDGVCFEMTKISRSTAKDYMFDYGAYSFCLLYTSPSPRDVEESRMPSSA